MSGSEVLPHDAPGIASASDVLWTARLLSHLRRPENLLVYLCVSAWAKFMGVSDLIPTITVG